MAIIDELYRWSIWYLARYLYLQEVGLKRVMRYVVAVSGGIDSVVLLDMLVNNSAEDELIVAHFDHGIRSDSAADARFVAGLAEHYSLAFVAKREELGQGTSEELARDRRYEFLRNEAEKHDATIVTAHHGDDVIETIAINLIRGTGWRGAAVLDTSGIIRPLLSMSKNEIRMYAQKRSLEWVEDSTNAETHYLRNRIRRKITKGFSSAQKEAILAVWRRQIELKDAIDEELCRYIKSDNEYDRYFLTFINPVVAREILRVEIMARNNESPTRPQLDRALLAIKTARSGSLHEVGNGVRLRFLIRTFIVETP